MSVIDRLSKGEEAASAVEYALLAGLIAAVIAGAVGTLGQSVNSIFSNKSLNDALSK